MFISEKEFLSLFGWDAFFEKATDLSSEKLRRGRVIAEEKNLYRVQTGLDETVLATVSGRLQFKAAGRRDLPAVGDWVLVAGMDSPGRAVIRQVLPRKSLLHRKQIGSGADAQILAINVDYAFVTTSLNEDLNFRRLERYLTMVWESGCQPVLLLTKADLWKGPTADIINDAQIRFPGVPVHAVSMNEFARADFLPRYLSRGKCAVFLGSSGVGKSTIVNYLIDDGRIKTKEIRSDDGKGRHTTTSRGLYISRFGGLVIDTPGMRELQLSDHADGLSAQFGDIEAWAGQCRFSDCHHETEPDCAIKAALESGLLTEERWRSYEKLACEIRHGRRKIDRAFASAERRGWKRISQESRRRKDIF